MSSGLTSDRVGLVHDLGAQFASLAFHQHIELHGAPECELAAHGGERLSQIASRLQGYPQVLYSIPPLRKHFIRTLQRAIERLPNRVARRHAVCSGLHAQHEALRALQQSVV